VIQIITRAGQDMRIKFELSFLNNVDLLTSLAPLLTPIALKYVLTQLTKLSPVQSGAPNQVDELLNVILAERDGDLKST